jgi:hypothetical protein
MNTISVYCSVSQPQLADSPLSLTFGMGLSPVTLADPRVN